LKRSVRAKSRGLLEGASHRERAMPQRASERRRSWPTAEERACRRAKSSGLCMRVGHRRTSNAAMADGAKNVFTPTTHDPDKLAVFKTSIVLMPEKQHKSRASMAEPPSTTTGRR
jgi:hypothetical protein